MRLERLRRMGVTELAVRGRQEVYKWLERVVGTRRTALRPDAVFRHLAPVPALAGIHARARAGDLEGVREMLLERFRQAGTAGFFDGATSPETPGLVPAQGPGGRHDVIATAEAICERRFDLLGYRGLWFGDPVDWHLDPTSGRRAPLVHWSQLNPLDADQVGDSKVVWELNRHQWLVRLGQAYRLTGDPRYAEAFARSVREWMRANPTGMGINWASSLEVALRLISWSWALHLFRDAEALSPGLFAAALDGIATHATHVERYLSYYFSPNTHLTGEALGLFYAGAVFPELRRAGHWRALGSRILVAECERQILPDGVYFELATCYQRYTVEIYLHFLMLAAQSGVAVPTSVRERVERMLDFLLAVRRPDGTVPAIGDADGGWLLPLATRGPEDARGVFSTAAALFGRSDCAWAAEHVAPETLWLLGPAGRRAFEALRPAPPKVAPSRVFTDGGYVVMRSGWDARAHHLVFDVGPLGCQVSGGHGHADLLSIQCSAFGEPYLVDPGTYGYTADRGWRDYFRGTAAHSTAEIDGVGQAEPSGPFAWKTRPRARLRRWLSTDGLVVAEADHDGYARLPDPVVHRREVHFVSKRYWVVVDDLRGSGEHRVEVRFQFAPMEVTVDPTLWVRARGRRGQALLVRSFAPVPVKIEVLEGELAPVQGWVSPDYGRRGPAPVLVCSAVAQLPIRIVTLLLPTGDPFAPPPAVSPMIRDRQGPVTVILEDYE